MLDVKYIYRSEIKPDNPNEELIENVIFGETFIQPKKTYEYIYKGKLPIEWKIDKKYPVILTKDLEKLMIDELSKSKTISDGRDMAFDITSSSSKN